MEIAELLAAVLCVDGVEERLVGGGGKTPCNSGVARLLCPIDNFEQSQIYGTQKLTIFPYTFNL